MKSFLFVISFLTLVLPQAWALEGTASLDFRVGQQMGYEVKNTLSSMSGKVVNIGPGSGCACLENIDGTWNGHFGFSRISTTAVTIDKKGIGHFEFTTMPGRQYKVSFESRKKDVRFSIVLPNGHLASVVAKKDNSNVSGGYFGVSFELDHKNAEKFSGILNTLGRIGYDSWDVYGSATGDLLPGSLAVQDPILFVILYFLPYGS